VTRRKRPRRGTTRPENDVDHVKQVPELIRQAVPELDMGSVRRQDFTGWLLVAGRASKQGFFHDRFDADVLLSVPREVTFFSLTELGGRISLARVRSPGSSIRWRRASGLGG
jgi:hypothetical protein